MANDETDTSRDQDQEAIPPLRKRKLNDGPLYTRPVEVEALLRFLVAIPEAEALARAQIRNRRSPGWLPGECLVHMMRRAGRRRDRRAYRSWYELVAQRVVAGLPRPADPKRPRADELEIVDVAFDRFVRLLGPDLEDYDDRLDIWEARFDLAVANLRRDALAQVLPPEDAPVTVEIDADPGVADEADRARGAFDPFDPAKMNKENFRSRVWAAIDALPKEQNRILTMRANGIPVGTGAEDEESISGILGMHPRTVNNHQRRAYDAIRRALEGDDA